MFVPFPIHDHSSTLRGNEIRVPDWIELHSGKERVKYLVESKSEATLFPNNMQPNYKKIACLFQGCTVFPVASDPFCRGTRRGPRSLRFREYFKLSSAINTHAFGVSVELRARGREMTRWRAEGRGVYSGYAAANELSRERVAESFRLPCTCTRLPRYIRIYEYISERDRRKSL